VALDTIRQHVEKLSHLKLVRFVLFSDEDFAHYQRALRK